VSYDGEIDEMQKDRFLGNARALLFPIDWPEPFGLAMIEALACGTPVIAYRCGSTPEIVDDGVTGFLVDDQPSAIAAARSIEAIDRRTCRRVFEVRFTSKVMARRYLEVFRALSAEPASGTGGTRPEIGED
jgi:glycosyltransferase involved in cell wall biosynthesis